MKLSVITVNLNNKSGLKKTLESIISQTFKDFEFIVIDGGSIDGSLELIQQNGNKISHWVSEKDKGTYHAMNKGILAANGDYCFFLNSGDYLTGNNVFEDIFNLNLNADIVCGNVLKIRKTGKYRIIVPHEKPTLLKLCKHSLPHQASLIKRSLFHEIGLYNEAFKIVSDFDFFLKALVVYKKTYQKVNINYSYFNLEGISSLHANLPLAIEESYKCLKENFPDMADDLMDYRIFYASNIGQTYMVIKKTKVLYHFIETFLGLLISIKKYIVGK